MATSESRYVDEARETLERAEARFAEMTRELESTPANARRATDQMAHLAMVAEVRERWERARVWLVNAQKIAARRGIITASVGVTLDEARAYLRAKGMPCGT